jgi:hypothetical protein
MLQAAGLAGYSRSAWSLRHDPSMPDDPPLEAAHQIHQFLAEVPELAPNELDEEGEPTELIKGAKLRDWILVMAWETPEGRIRLTRCPSPNLPAYRENGLLFEALHSWG